MEDYGQVGVIESRTESRLASVESEGVDLTRVPSLVEDQVRDLPEQGLFEPDTQGALRNASMRVRYECTRLASLYQYPLEQIDSGDVASFEDYQCLRRYFEKHAGHDVEQPQEIVSQLDWEAAGDGFAEISLKGKLEFRPTGVGPLFQLRLKALRKERSCRFQRAFGGDRYLYLSVPALTPSKLPRHLKGQQAKIRASYQEWLRKEKRFLGCTWATLLVERKSSKPGRLQDRHGVGGQSVVLFATQAAQSMIPIEDAINWFLPTQSNIGQPRCKAYARLELGFSKTLPTLSFLPSQIREVGDILADGTAESTRFLEKGQRLKESFDPEKPKVMNDGCSRISLGAAQQIAKILGLAERPPSVYQARIGCWKGLWMVDVENTPSDRKSDVWIEVTPSQKKFDRHPEDLDDEAYDSRRTTFEVVTWSTPVASARLSPTLVPILLDRGVPEQTLHDLFQASLAYERKSLTDAIKTPQLLYRWVYSKASIMPDEQDTESAWLGSLPFTNSKAALYLLEHGFLPYELPYLARIVRDLMKKHLSNLKKYLKPRVGRSVNVLAIADPLGCLYPGDVHLAFSEDFIDEQSGSLDTMLHDIDLVVGRQPALRGSDMQKVRGVFKPELRHLRNVIVFPSRGIFPMAERLQNGDYDGDIFWVTWDPAIVDNFQNAPSPPGLPEPESLGIEVDEGKLDGSFMTSNKKAIRKFLDFNIEFRCQQDMLGICTNFHDSFAYAQNSIRSVGVEALADLHDHLVDASKMGYTFTEERWKRFIKSDPRITEKSPEEPLHKRLMGGASQNEIHSAIPKDAVDRLLLMTVIPTADAIVTEVQDLLKNDSIKDEALCGPLRSVQVLAEDESDYREDLNLLVKGIRMIYGTWKRGLRENTDGTNLVPCIAGCYKAFRSLMPTTAFWNLHQEMEILVSPSPTAWDLLKASVTYSEYPNEAFTWRMAGKELSYIKAWSIDGTRTISPLFYTSMKLKSIKHVSVQEDEEE